MIVVDTNIIAYLYIHGDQTETVTRLLAKEPHWAAPLLWRSEFRNVLTSYLRRGILSLIDVLGIMEEAMNLMAGHEFQVASLHVFSLVERSRCSAYDCEFVALAQEKGTVLVTTDKQILREFPDIAVRPDIFLALNSSD